MYEKAVFPSTRSKKELALDRRRHDLLPSALINERDRPYAERWRERSDGS
jgi:hypothetical protein